MTRRKVLKIVTHIVLSLTALAYIIPFYIVFITAFKANNAVATATPFIWFPVGDQLGVQGFIDVFKTYTIFSTGKSMVATGFKNTLIIIVPVIVGGMFSSSLAAYAFAKMKFRLKKAMFTTLMFSMMLPGIILLIPSYFVYDNLALTNTFFPLIVPPMFGSALGVFFLRKYYTGIPDELLEAAKMDGLGHFGIYFRIVLPLSIPALIAQGLLGLVATYNDYLNPLIYLLDEEKYTLQIALSMFASGNTNSLHTVMAGSIIAMLPMLIIYFLLQKHFVNGLTMSGMKG
jgi:multiple sugar transport system permease protein